jgi:hypothetical protein
MYTDYDGNRRGGRIPECLADGETQYVILVTLGFISKNNLWENLLIRSF